MLAKKHIESWDHGWCWPSNSWILPCWDYLSRGVVKFNHLNLRPMCLWVSMKIGDNHGTLKLPGKIMITSHGCWIFTVGCWIRIIEMPRPVIHYVQKNIDVIPWHTARATLIGGLRNMAFIFHFIYGIILPISLRGRSTTNQYSFWHPFPPRLQMTPRNLNSYCDFGDHGQEALSAGEHGLDDFFSLKDCSTHRIHGAGIYAHIWGILMVNVTIYSIHGSYGVLF